MALRWYTYTMAFFYPRKQTVIIFVVCTLAVSGAAYYASNNASAGQSTANIVIKSGTVVADAQNALTSTNADWQKQFLNNTSGKTTTTGTKNQGAIGQNAPLTATDKLGQQLFTSYMELKQANLLDNTDVVNQTAEDLVTSSFNAEQPKIYTQKDLHIISASDEQTLKQFSSSVTDTIDSYTAKESEASIIQEYLTNSDSAILKRLDPIISTYKRMVAELLSVPTPQVMAADQLQIINAFSSLLFAAQSLQISDSDTVKGLAGVTMHVNGTQQVTNALENMNTTLSDKGVILTVNQDVLNAIIQ